MTPQEGWLPVPEFPHYEVSDLGRVRRGARVLKAWPIPQGYLYVTLCDGIHHRRRVRVHVLVMEVFVGPRPEGMPDIRHLDGDPTNNVLANLTYGTKSENSLDIVRHGRHHLASRTHCKHGHEYTPENTEVGRNATGTYRRCVTCRRAYNRASAQRAKDRQARGAA